MALASMMGVCLISLPRMLNNQQIDSGAVTTKASHCFSLSFD